MLFELHTALYWKANKKYAASQGIKPQSEAENENNSATEVRYGNIVDILYNDLHWNILSISDINELVLIA